MTYMTIVIGAVCTALGIWGTMATWPLMRQAVLALALASMMLGGVLAMLIGVSEMANRRNRRRDAKTSEPEPPAP